MKEYKKKKYAVSCRQLEAPPTKEGSYQQANAWWEAKKASLDGCSRAGIKYSRGKRDVVSGVWPELAVLGLAE